MLRSNLKMPGNMMLAEEWEIAGIICKGEIVTDTRTNKHFFNTRDFPDCVQEFTQVPVTRVQAPAGSRAMFVRTCACQFPNGHRKGKTCLPSAPRYPERCP